MAPPNFPEPPKRTGNFLIYFWIFRDFRFSKPVRNVVLEQHFRKNPEVRRRADGKSCKNHRKTKLNSPPGHVENPYHFHFTSESRVLLCFQRQNGHFSFYQIFFGGNVQKRCHLVAILEWHGLDTFLCTSWLGHSTPAAAPRVPRLVHSTPAAATRMPRRARPDAPASSLQGGGGRYAFLKNPGEQVKHYSFFA